MSFIAVALAIEYRVKMVEATEKKDIKFVDKIDYLAYSGTKFLKGV